VSVWRSHGLAVERRLGLVACEGAPPRLYPNAVTLDAYGDPAAQAAWLATLGAGAGVSGAVSVKDSFATLDLSSARFHRLFEAEWTLRRPGLGAAPSDPSLEWRLVESETDLADWEAAWAGPKGEGAPRIFKPELLADRGVGFLAGRREGRITAGCILTPTGQVVGLGNIFGAYADAVAIAATMFPGRAMVGYERGEDLKLARGCGFKSLGPLKVWSRPDSPT
jgi:hypothetical protein